jgi:hypothetical protein
MEIESVGHFLFVAMDISMSSMALWAIKITTNPHPLHTHNNLYLSTKSYQHPCNKQAALSSLVQRAGASCNEGSLQAKLVFLMDFSKQNYWSDR